MEMKQLNDTVAKIMGVKSAKMEWFHIGRCMDTGQWTVKLQLIPTVTQIEQLKVLVLADGNPKEQDV